MRAFEHIVVGIDFSQPSARALDTAAVLSGEDGRITALHACADFMPDHSLLPPEQWNRLRTAAYEEAESQIEQFISSLRQRHPNLAGKVAFGGASDQLLHWARDEKADLIVVGAVGRGMVMRALLGSTAESLARRSTLPVWVAHNPARKPQKIVAALDESPESARVFALSRQIARAFGASLILVHAYPDLSSAPIFTQAEAMTQLRLQENQRLAALQAMEALRAKLGWGETWDVAVEERVVPGRPHEAITEIATEVGADLVALGTHGHSALYRLTVGSTTDKVLRTAPCDVLVVPGATREG
jgi:nucleotide-binding universal stress UspA family protein